MKQQQPHPKSAEIEKQQNTRKQVSYNRRARHEYEILDTYEAGMVLVGTEVKSLRAGKVNIQDAFCKIENNECWLYNMHITPYELGNRFNVEPTRKRKLLLHHWQIQELRVKMEQKGLAVVPISLYFLRGFAKMEIGIGRGKKLYDKRESIAERDQLRDAQREHARRE